VKPRDRNATFHEAAAAAEEMLKRLIATIITRDAKSLHQRADLGRVAQDAATTEVDQDASTEEN
jgi:hypothetical protein